MHDDSAGGAEAAGQGSCLQCPAACCWQASLAPFPSLPRCAFLRPPFLPLQPPTHPTLRTLGSQIEEEAKNLAHFTPYRIVSVVGGQSIEDQGFLLRKGCEIVVATPGRLVDCVERSYAGGWVGGGGACSLPCVRVCGLWPVLAGMRRPQAAHPSPCVFSGVRA